MIYEIPMKNSSNVRDYKISLLANLDKDNGIHWEYTDKSGFLVYL